MTDVSSSGEALEAGLEDDQLMQLAREQVVGAFDQLVRRHEQRVLGLARRYVGDKALAADVAQDTFVALFRALPQYQAQGRFRAYLYRLLLNQCRMARRKSRDAGRLEALSWLTDPAVDPSDVLARERLRDVERELAGLSTVLREAVLLRYTANMSYQDIGDVLGVPLGTAKRRVCVAMTKLRQALGDL